MSSSDQEDNKINLIPLESKAIRPMASRAKTAYNSYHPEEETEKENELEIETDQEEVKQKKIEPKENKVIEKKVPEPKKIISNQKKKITKKQDTPPKKVSKKSVPEEKGENEEEEEDIFDEEGNIYEDGVEGFNEKLDELKESLHFLWKNFYNTLSTIFLKVASILFKPIILISSILATLMSIPLKFANSFISSLADKVGAKPVTKANEDIEEEIEEEIPISKALFSDIIELNITFTDNYKKNLYKVNNNSAYKLSKMEEELIFNNAILAIKECAEFTVELPPPGEGIYEGKEIHKIMEEVTQDEVEIFLGFVKAFPGKYIGKTWKVSETFATWLINNSPTG